MKNMRKISKENILFINFHHASVVKMAWKMEKYFHIFFIF